MHNQNEELSEGFMRSWRMRTWMTSSRKLERKFASEMEVIKRDSDEIAMDIVNHFPRRISGKGMVITRISSPL